MSCCSIAALCGGSIPSETLSVGERHTIEGVWSNRRVAKLVEGEQRVYPVEHVRSFHLVQSAQGSGVCQVEAVVVSYSFVLLQDVLSVVVGYCSTSRRFSLIEVTLNARRIFTRRLMENLIIRWPSCLNSIQ